MATTGRVTIAVSCAGWILTVVLATSGCASVLLDDLVGPWADPSGRALPDGTDAAGGTLLVTSFLASSHCDGRKDTVYLELAWPVGNPLSPEGQDNEARVRYYVRGESVEQRVSSEPYDPDVVLPASALPTGYTRSGNVIWVDPVGPAYVTRANGRTERWPQIELGCA